MKTTTLAIALLLASGSYAETTPVVSIKPKSPLNGTTDRPKKIEAFINLQYIAVGKNGNELFQETQVPVVDLKYDVGVLARSRGMTREQFLAQDESVLKSLLLPRYGSLGSSAEDAVDNALLLNRISRMEAGDMYHTLEQEMSHVSFGRKVGFLANFLSYLSDNYDYNAAAASGINASDKELIDAIRGAIDTGTKVPAGVCRHMHQMAVRYAQAMGIQEAFGVGFRTMDGSGHRTLVLTTPDDPTKVVQLNYSGVVENNGVAGPTALSQNHTLPDTGIRFRVFNGKDEVAVILPSEQGAILNSVTGGEDSDLSLNYKSQAQINQFGIATPFGTVRFFHAETPMGNQTAMVGAAYNIKINYNDVFYGEYGIAGFSSERTVELGEIKSMGGYGRMTQGFNWVFYQSNSVKLSAFGELHFRGALYCAAYGDEKCSLNMDYDISLTTGTMARYHTGPLSHRTAILLQGQEGAGTNNEIKLPIIPVVKVTHDIDFKIGKSFTGNVGGAVTMYNLGTGNYFTYNGHTGISSQKTNTFIGLNADGRITNDTPFWLPGAEHQASAIIKQSVFGEKLFIGVDGRQSIDVKDNRYLGLTLGGKF